MPATHNGGRRNAEEPPLPVLALFADVERCHRPVIPHHPRPHLAALPLLHMQEQARTPASVPHLHRILQRSRQRLQSRIHLAALVLLSSTVWPEGLARIAGVAAALSFALLWWNLLSALRVYRGFIRTGASEHTSHLCAQAAPSHARSAAGSSIAQRRLSRSTPKVRIRPASANGTS